MSRLGLTSRALLRTITPRTRLLSTASAFDTALSSSSSSSSSPFSPSPSSSSRPIPSTTSSSSPSHDPLAVDPDSETLNYLARLIMQDGKLTRSHVHLSLMLESLQLQTQSPPLPILYKALELTSPQVRIVGRRKGTKVLQTPQPLSQKQKVRQAWLWIVEASDKRQSTEKVFGKRLAQEVMAVLNGQSEALKKLVARHEQAVTGRAKYVRSHWLSLSSVRLIAGFFRTTVLDDRLRKRRENDYLEQGILFAIPCNRSLQSLIDIAPERDEGGCSMKLKQEREKLHILILVYRLTPKLIISLALFRFEHISSPIVLLDELGAVAS